ncbi:tdrd9 [Symbiodinium sp. CCMP2592]|nr:tdrd9 [Symbiodinium sp. CCMP2592]
MEVTCTLVQQLAKPGCTIIVFLPGIADITQLFESLAPLDDVRSFGRPGVVRRPDCPRLRIFALHSMVPRQEQEEVFNEVPKDRGHVVLASNIAESSLTLPSVCAVVDLALRRTVQYDTRRLMCCLVTTWCSQSSCKQRRGRAGRTMPGRALCLVPRRYFESELPAFDPPEMLNAPLTKLYLQAKQLCSTLSRVSDRVQLPPDVNMDISSPKALLNEVVQPPSLSLLDAAIQELSAVGCLTMPTEEAEITPLGQIAVALPCDLRICRLLFLGCLFGCPTDALAMAAGLTGPDPFSTPSLLVLKDQKEYVQKLERSFASRRWCDHGTFSEPIMMHSLFKEWIRAGAPRGAKALGSFVRDWSIIPKKFESLTADATELTVRFLKLLKTGRPRNNLEELLSAMHHKVDKGDDLLRTSGWGNPERIFSSDVDKLRCLLAMAFSDQMLLHLNPRWAPSSGGKKRLEEQLLDLMYKYECDPHNTVGIFVPAGHDEEGVKELCEEMCGEEPEMVIIDEKAKMALAGFAHSTEKEALDHEAVLLWDVPSSIHRLHMFGSGRYRFFVERPKSEEPPVEIFKPVHPFMLQWDVLTHPGGGKKKPPTVKGMCDWRNPMGFACHVDDSKPPAEFVGCCASIQGLEGGAQAFVSGASVLPMRFLPALLSTLCPERWCVAWGVDAGSSEVRGVRILHHELVNLPKNTLAPPVLEAVNALRTGLREALYPASWWAWDDWGGDSRGRNHRGRHEDRDGELLDLPDLSQLLRELIEVMPDPESSGVQRPKKMKWPPATTFSQDWEEEDECFLRTLQPLAEREDLRWGHAETGGKDTNFPELVEHLAKNGECAMSSLPSKIRKTKKQLQKRPDLFVIRPTKKDCFVRLAGTASTEVATSNAKTKPQKGAGGRERPLVDALVRVLTGRGAVGLGELGSQESLKKLLKKQQPDLQKIRQFVTAFPGVFHLGMDASGQVAVTLSGDGVRSLPLVKSAKGGKSGKGGKRSASGAKHKGSNPSVLTEHISSLCGSSPATAADFDGRVKALLLDVQDKQGAEALDECFDNLHEWLSKKGDRSSIGNWPAYITKLVVNWKDRMQ